MESLYTTYRPQTFEDVAGQRAIVGALERAVVNGTVGHAYLFCGPRGTGKTTLARILAKALECDAGPGVLPDGTCEQCEAIAAGVHPDVQELDAASRNGVNDIRDEVISKVNFAPVRGRYKVYIIDEVHMLTPAAFNALLKTLEEPPEHVVFIFCTTDPQKILPTVLSRVQRYNFSPLSGDDIRQRLEFICQREGFSVTPEAMALIVRHAHGGMRDAISTLEQLAIFGDGSVDEAMARDLLGSAAGDTLSRFVEALAARDAAALFSLVAAIVSEGRDLQQFDAELLARVRDLYVVSVAGALPGVVLATGDELVELQREASLFEGPDRLSRILGELDHVTYALRTAPDPRLVFEVALTKLVRPECDLTLESLAERIAMLEAGGVSGPVATAPRPAETASGSISGAPRSATVEPVHPVQPRSSMPPNGAMAESGPAVASAQGRPAASGAPRPVKSAPNSSDSAGTARQASPSQPPARPNPMQVEPEPAVSAAHPGSPVRRAPVAQSAAAVPPAVSTAPVPVVPDDESWQRVVATLPASHAAFLTDSRALADDGSVLTVGIAGESHFTLGMLNRQDMKATIEQAASRVLGPRRIEFVKADGPDAGGSFRAPAPAEGQVRSSESPFASESVRPFEPASSRGAFSASPTAGAGMGEEGARPSARTAPPTPFEPLAAPAPSEPPAQPVPPASPASGMQAAPSAAPRASRPAPGDAVGYEDIPPASVYDDVPPWEDLPLAPSSSEPNSPAPSASAPHGSAADAPARTPIPSPAQSGPGAGRAPATSSAPGPAAPPTPSTPSRSARPSMDRRSTLDGRASMDAWPSVEAGYGAGAAGGSRIDVSGLDPRLSTIVETLSNAFGSVEVIGVDPAAPPASGGPAGTDPRTDG